MSKRNNTKFKRNLAMTIYLPIKFYFDQTNRLLVRVQKREMFVTMLTNEQNAKKRTNVRNNTKFERNLAMVVIYLPTKFDFDQKNRFLVRVRKR